MPKKQIAKTFRRAVRGSVQDEIREELAQRRLRKKLKLSKKKPTTGLFGLRLLPIRRRKRAKR